MPDQNSLNELFRRAVTFPGPNTRLAGLEIALDVVEAQLVHARDQAAVRLHARHRRYGSALHPDDRAQEYYELEVTTEQILPQVFRGGFVLTLWSVFEVVVKDMAEYAYAQRSLSFASSLFRQPNFLAQMDKVYSKSLGVIAFPNNDVRSQLDSLRLLRNTLVHHNGSVAALPDALRCAGKSEYAAIGLHLYSDVHHEYVVPNEQYIRRNFEIVQTYLASLADRLYQAVHPEPLTDEDI